MNFYFVFIVVGGSDVHDEKKPILSIFDHQSF